MFQFKLIAGISLLFSLNVTAQTILLQTDFESGIPAAYTSINYDGLTPAPVVSTYVDAWNAVINPTDPTDTVAGSTSYFSPIGKADRWLITPQLVLGSFGNYLNWEARSQDASYPDDYLVLLSTTGTSKTDFKDTIGNIQGEYAAWTTRSISLTDKGFDDSTVYIAFVNRTNNGFKLYLDDIQVSSNDPLAVKSMTTDAIRIYPNPTTGIIHIEAKGFKSITLLDLQGKNLERIMDNTNLDLSGFPSGIYILEIESQTGVYRRSITKF